MRSYALETGLAGVSDFIHSEYDQTYTSEKRTLLAGSGGVRLLPQFALIALVITATATVTAGAVVGTGNGAIGVVTADAGAPEGVWQVIIIEPAANAGAFEVRRPDGSLDGTGNVAVAYNGGLNFTLADGATDFVAGAYIPVTVDYPADKALKVVRWDPAATNGAQVIAGVNLFEATAPDGVDATCTTLERGPVVARREAIAWHSGVTDAQKADAWARLGDLGIQCRISG